MGNRLNTAIGPTPLALNHADNGEIESLVQYGKCEQKPVDYLGSVTQSGVCEQRPVDYLASVTQTGVCEQKPVDYLASVTQTGVCEQRNLPKGYVELTYLQSNGTQLLQLEITRQSGKAYAMQADIEASVFGSTSSGMFTLGSDYAGYCVVSRKWNTTNMVMMSGGVYDSGIVYNGRATYTVSAAADGLTCTLTDGTNTASFTRTSANYDTKPVLFGLNANYKGSVKIFSSKLWEDSILLFDLVPCKNAENVCGFFNRVDGSFITPIVGTLIAGDVVVPTPINPMSIWCNNGAIKCSMNLCDVNSNTASIGYYISAHGVVTADTYNWMYQDYICVSPNTTYTLSISRSVYYVTISEYSTAEDSGFVVRKNGSTGSNTSLTITTGATTKFIRFGANIDRTTVTLNKVLGIKWMLTETAEALPYHPYKEIYYDGTPEQITDALGNTAMAVNLFGLIGYADTQEFLSGAVGRQVGIYVFTGEEAFIKGNAFYTSNTSFLPSKAGSIAPICTHFKGISSSATRVADSLTMTVNGPSGTYTGCVYFYADRSLYATGADFQAFLAAQFRAGTPVIIVYPLATVTTESVPGQMLASEPLTISAEVNVPTLVTTTAPVSTPDPNHPLSIWCNNGELKYGQYGKNLFNKDDTAQYIAGYIDSNTGALTAATTGQDQRCFCVPCKPNTAYTLSGMTANSAWGGFSNKTIGSIASIKRGGNGTITTGASDRYLIGLAYLENGQYDYRATLQIEEGDTATSYEPYHFGLHTIGTPEVITDVNGNTARVENLFGVGNYADTQEFLAGAVGRQVGIKVLDGTEAFEELEGAAIIRGATATWGAVAKAVGLCTHLVSLSEADTPSAGTYRFATALNFYQYKTTFGVSTIPELKALLAELFAAGTPVIIIYPLATPTTESVSPQMLVSEPLTVTAEVTVPALATTTAPVSTPDPKHQLPIWCNNGVLKWDTINQTVYADGTSETITDVFGNTATAVNLFGIGSASDTQEFLSGAVGRQVGVYVFTGEEAFTVSASEAMITVIPDVAVGADNTPINTHFALETSPTSIANGTQRFGASGTKIYSTNYYMKHPTITTVPDFQAWLAAQYAAGTPVTVLYPLATATSESVPAQMLVKEPLTVTAEVTVPTLATTTAAVSTPDRWHSLPVWCNNGKLTKSANLVDVNGQTPVNLAYSTNKLVTNAERYGYYIKVKPNTKYTVSINREKTGAYLNICETASEPTNNVSVVAYNTMDGTISSKTITTKGTTNWLYVYTAYVSGYHPFVNGDFQIELGQTASVYHPFVYADGTPEVLTVSGVNLANMVAENIDVGKIIYDTGSVSNSAVNFVYNKYIPVEAGQNYVLYGRRKSDNAISAYNRICWYTANKGWISRATYTKDTIGSAVAPNNAAYARFTVAPVDNSGTLTLDDVLDFNWTFAKATEEIPYQPYVQPQTASVVDLLGLTEDYRDTHELVHGIKTGVVGVMVLTGNEGDWVKTTSGDRVMFYRNSGLTSAASVTTSSGIILCTIATHRSNSWTPISSVIVQRSNKNFGLMNPEGFTVDSTVDDWTNYLKAKYAADPVMIFYPLASSIISQTTPQSLYTTNGTNTISLTAEINDIQLDCKYLPFPTIVSLILRRRLLKKYLTPSVVGYGRVGFTQTI